MVIPTPDYVAQTELWERRLEGLLGDGVDIEALVARFDLTGGQIARAANMAESQSLARDSDSGPGKFGRVRSLSKPHGLNRKETCGYLYN